MSGSVAGIIMDSSGATIAGASLTLVHTSTGATRGVTSDVSGNFLFNAVDGGEYSLRIRLPMLVREKLRIRSTGDELVLQLENQRRIISLPSALSGYHPVRANYEESYLTVCFEKIKKELLATEGTEITEK